MDRPGVPLRVNKFIYLLHTCTIHLRAAADLVGHAVSDPTGHPILAAVWRSHEIVILLGPAAVDLACRVVVAIMGS